MKRYLMDSRSNPSVGKLVFGQDRRVNSISANHQQNLAKLAACYCCNEQASHPREVESGYRLQTRIQKVGVQNVLLIVFAQN